MDWDRIARGVTGLVVLAALVAGYQLLDPRLGGQQTVEVDTDSDNATKIAVQSVRKLQTQNYRVVESTARNVSLNPPPAALETRLNISISNSQRRFHTRQYYDGETAHVYGNGHYAYTKAFGDDDWEANTGRPFDAETNMLHSPQAWGSMPVSIQSRNESAVVLRVTNTTRFYDVTWGVQGDGPETETVATITVDRESGLVRRYTVWQNLPDGGTEYSTYRFADYGETTVERPEGIGFNTDELVADLLE